MAGLRWKVGLSEAARLAGKQRSTILRAIQSGRLSESKDAHGQRRVDVAELERVYGPLRTPSAAPGAPNSATVAPNDTESVRRADDAARADLERLRGDLDRERARTERLEAELREARAAVEAWTERFAKFAERALLTDRSHEHPAPPAAPASRPPTGDPPPHPEAGERSVRGVLADGVAAVAAWIRR